MAKSRLTTSVVALVVSAAGAGAEVLAPAGTVGLAIGDYAAGAGLALVPALARAELVSTVIALVAASAWFLAGPVGGLLLLAHRGPVLHLLAPRRARAPAAALVLVGYAGALLPLTYAGPVTTGVAALVGLLAVVRRAWLSAGLAAALGLTWLAAVVGGVSVPVLLLVGDALLVAVAVSVARGEPGSSLADLVVDLGPGGRGAPVTAQLRAVLVDPDLELRFRVAETSWVDESGRAVAAPTAEATTYADAPNGARVALVHGATAIRQPELEHAAARAAALALDAARLSAESRRQAEAVRASGARLLAAADTERRALEARLSADPLPRLERVEALLDGDLRAEAVAARRQLEELAAGLFPVGELDVLLRELADRSSVPTTVEVSGPTDRLPETHRVALYFVASEALANVAKHAGATVVRVRIEASRDAVSLEIVDDGRGSAAPRPGGGLDGLADRVAMLRGHLEVTSPAGSGTAVSVRLPLADPPTNG